MTMVMVVAPMLAPLIGGFLDVGFGWRAPLAFVLAMGLIVLAVTARKLPETLATPAADVRLAAIPRDFARLLRRRAFLGYAFTVAFTSVTFLSFVGGAPYVTVELLGGTPGDYGLFFIPVAGAYMVGNFVSARATLRVGIDRMISVGSFIVFCGGSAVLAFQLAGVTTFGSVFGCMALIAFGHGFCIPNGLAGAVSVDHSRAGAAAGLSGSLQMGLGALASVIVGATMADTAIPLAVGMFIGAVGTVAAHLWGVVLAPRIEDLNRP